MKILSITRKALIELWREPLLLGLLLFFPIVLVGFYYIAFGQTNAGLSNYLTVLVQNEDRGSAGDALMAEIRAAQWDGQTVFTLVEIETPRTAEIALQERKAAILVRIPVDFSQLLATDRNGAHETPAIVTLAGDPASDRYLFAQSFLGGIIRMFARQVADLGEEALPITYTFLPGTGTMSDFDFGVGGIIIFGIMFGIISSATLLVRETVTGTLRRLRLTRARARDVVIGITLAQTVAAAVQVPITLGAALLMGFRNNGSPWLVMAIAMLVNLSAVGVGLIVACFARNDGDAANLGSGALVPMVFLSGALFPMPKIALAEIAGRSVSLYDLLPTTHASEAMRRVTVFGDSAGQVGYELVMMTVLSLLFLAVGVMLYRRLQLRKL